MVFAEARIIILLKFEDNVVYRRLTCDNTRTLLFLFASQQSLRAEVGYIQFVFTYLNVTLGVGLISLVPCGDLFTVFRPGSSLASSLM